MKFNNKPLSFLIDDILKSPNQSTHIPFQTMNKHVRLENFSDYRFPSLCQSNFYHYHFNSTYSNFIHHRRCRRTRTVFSDTQLIGLEKRFETQKYLSTSDRIELADMLHLSQLQVKTWYQNRRMKWKKQVLQEGYKEIPTKPKGRPKKNSIPSYAELQKLKNEKQIRISSLYTSDDESNNKEEFIDIKQ